MTIEYFKVPTISSEKLAIMTGVKNSIQINLMEKMLGHFPSDDEAMKWIDMYANDVNSYFSDHPDTTLEEGDKIEEYLLEKRKNSLH